MGMMYFSIKNSGVVIFNFLYRSIGFIPSNYVKEKELLGLQQYEYVYLNSIKYFLKCNLFQLVRKRYVQATIGIFIKTRRQRGMFRCKKLFN